MRFAVDGWNPEYGVALDASFDPSDEPVDVAVECDADAWAPVSPPAGDAGPGSVVFIDGVRRIDASVWVTPEDDPTMARPGVCATVAAGAVKTSRGSLAEVLGCRVHRGVYAAGAERIDTVHGPYVAVPIVEDTPEGLYLAVHSRMTALEAEVSAEVLAGAGGEVEMVVFDGPLRGRGAGVGYVKTQHVQYLPDELHRVVGRLDAGERSPVFLIGGRFSRWSWYVRLPCVRSHPLSGVVRCELPLDHRGGTVDAVAHDAGGITAMLARFSSEAHKDPRAPQNLYPIAGLERELRRRLGDPRLLETALRRAAAA